MLNGRVAIVTGSTGGIGQAIARALARQHATVVLNGFGTSDYIEKLKHDISQIGNSTVAYDGADLVKSEEATALVTRTEDRFGRVDILINNAGDIHNASIEEHSTEEWNRIMALNLSASFHTIRAALPRMREQGWGRVVNIASAYGLVGGEKRSSYVASKFGLVGLTKAVALETAGTPITCNAVCPGWVRSPHVEKLITRVAEKEGVSLGEAEARIVGGKMPSGRAVHPESIAELVLFACSPAAAEMRGSTLALDGGWTAS